MRRPRPCCQGPTGAGVAVVFAFGSVPPASAPPLTSAPRGRRRRCRCSCRHRSCQSCEHWDLCRPPARPPGTGVSESQPALRGRRAAGDRTTGALTLGPAVAALPLARAPPALSATVELRRLAAADPHRRRPAPCLALGPVRPLSPRPAPGSLRPLPIRSARHRLRALLPRWTLTTAAGPWCLSQVAPPCATARVSGRASYLPPGPAAATLALARRSTCRWPSRPHSRRPPPSEVRCPRRCRHRGPARPR